MTIKSLKYKATTKRQLQTENKPIMSDGLFSCILIKNVGTSIVTVHDVIELKPGEFWLFDNQPYVIINEDISIVFTSEVGKVDKIFVIKTYFEEVKL
jgi:hypothetical protein